MTIEKLRAVVADAEAVEAANPDSKIARRRAQNARIDLRLAESEAEREAAGPIDWLPPESERDFIRAKYQSPGSTGVGDGTWST